MCACICVGRTNAGTTDTATELGDHPQPNEEVRFILKEVKNNLSPDISDQCMHGVTDISAVMHPTSFKYQTFRNDMHGNLLSLCVYGGGGSC